LCLGTDWLGDSEARPLAPLANLAIAVTHGGHGTAERITATEALEAYTLGSAYGEGMEREKGSIERGKLADVVLLSRDPTTTLPTEMAQIHVRFTMVGGRIVYRERR
jgi:predicted amidohydrolase YtcJ